MMLSPATPASGATFCQSSSVMKGMMGGARGSGDSNTLARGLRGARCVLAAVVAFQVHQREAGGVPQLVAEIAVALGALQVELDVAAVRGQTREGKAQSIGAEGGDALGGIGA